MSEKETQPLDEAITALNKRNKKMMMMVIAVALISLVGTGGTAAYLLLFKGAEATAAVSDKDEHTGEEHDASYSAETDETKLLGPTHALEDMVINLSGEDASRFLKLSVVIEVEDEATLEELVARLPQIQDITLTLVSSKTNADLQGADGKYRLREEMRYRFNKIFKGRIGRIYFTTFVVQ